MLLVNSSHSMVNSFIPSISEPNWPHCHGIVRESIDFRHGGRVQYQSTEWPARLSQRYKDQPCMSGTIVNVIGRVALTLIVEPV